MRAALLLLLLCGSPALAGAPASHAPMREVAKATPRVPADGTSVYVDPAAKPDGDGSARHPFQSVTVALKGAHPGDTINLIGGVYREPVVISVKGTAKAPITIRSASNESAIITTAFPEFEESPRTAWEPVPNHRDEFRSTKRYESVTDPVLIAGFFLDSMIPLHPYRLREDFQSANEFWNVPGNAIAGNGIYVGPGLWFDRTTQRFHIRISPTTVSPDNYQGSRDPRQLPLSIGTTGQPPLTIENAEHVVIQDLVVHGMASAAIRIESSRFVEIDGTSIYGGSPGINIHATEHFLLHRSVLRGTAAPWSSRASMKYRGRPSFLLVSSGALPQNLDFEFAYNEFTDSHDGMTLASVKGVRFHHNLVDNLNDDGIFLTERGRRALPTSVHIYENIFSRVLTTLAFGQDMKPGNAVGDGAYVYRNVFDLRDGTYNTPPKASGALPNFAFSRPCGDHGAPTWEPLYFYQNTVLTGSAAYRNYYGALLVMSTERTRRRLFNNIFQQSNNLPGLSFANTNDDLQVDGNLMWSTTTKVHGDFFSSFRKSKMFTESKRLYKPGWGANDRYGDPSFADLAHADFRITAASPAADHGIPIPTGWPDVGLKDEGSPDIGALPVGAPMLRVGPKAAPLIPSY